jgi:hypothetical protein
MTFETDSYQTSVELVERIDKFTGLQESLGKK